MNEAIGIGQVAKLQSGQLKLGVLSVVHRTVSCRPSIQLAPN